MSDLAMEFGKVNTCHDERGRFCSGSTHSRIQAVKELAAKDPRVAESEKLNREGGDSRNWVGVQKDGHYTPKAHAENMSIAESFLNPAAKAKEGEAPIAIILLGKPGAGKTTVVKSMGNTVPTTMINSDDIKEKIPGYKPNARQIVHERGCDIARNYLAPAAVEARHNITFDMTDNQERVVKMAAELKAKGYKIGVIHVDVDNATSAERVYSRFQQTGVYVPVHVALSYGDKPEKSYQALKSSGLADQWRKYDNSSYGKPPKQLDAGGKDVFKRGAVGSLGAGFGGGSNGRTSALAEEFGGLRERQEVGDIELEFEKGGGNPCHTPSGSKGGQFCSTGSGGGTEVTVVFQPSAKMLRAIQARVPCGADKQRVADQQEKTLARALGLPRTGDNSTFDLRNDKVGVEVKCMQDSKNGKITMSSAALARKVKEARKAKLHTFTVVADKRQGQTQYYARKGVGSFRISAMTPMTISELRGFIK